MNLNKTEITQTMSSEKFVQEILNAQSKWNISEDILEKANNYFGFQIENNQLIGFPVLPKNLDILNEITGSPNSIASPITIPQPSIRDVIRYTEAFK